MNSESEAKFQVYYIPATWDQATARMFKRSPYLRPRNIMRAASLEQAIRGSDLYVKKNVVKGQKFTGFVVVILNPLSTPAKDLFS